jgi:Reverse transcriptase (RNA-dependent DNA polymerase)
MNERTKRAIKIHNGIHGFQSGRGCQTPLFEAKTSMEAREHAGLPYHQIFLDLSKAFDTVNREPLLSIMRTYGFGFRLMHFFQTCRAGVFVALCAVGVYGPQVPIGAGVRKGDVILPMLFILMVDSILQLTDQIKPELWDRVLKVFYADDGRTGNKDAMEVQEVQDVIDNLFDLFECIGVFVNTSKTITASSHQRGQHSIQWSNVLASLERASWLTTRK